MKRRKTYIDENGYFRFIGSKRLVHRWIAQKYLYNKNDLIYALPFGEYIIHHKDRNKLNNSINNLMIVTPDEHFRIHFPFSAFINDIFNWLFKKVQSLFKK